MRWKDKKEKQAAEQEFWAFFEDYRAIEGEVCSFPLESQKEAFRAEWELFEKMDHMRREALFDSGEIFAEHRKEIYHCIRICLHLRQTGHYSGLKPLLMEGKKLEKSGRLCARFLEMLSIGCQKRVVQSFFLSCVPLEERSGLLKYLEYQTV